jgi:hypothetical protein
LSPIPGMISDNNSITNREASLTPKSETPSYTTSFSQLSYTHKPTQLKSNPQYCLGSTTYPNYFCTSSRPSTNTIDHHICDQQQYLKQYESNLHIHSSQQIPSSSESHTTDWFGDIIKHQPGWDTGSKMTTLCIGCVNINSISQDLINTLFKMVIVLLNSNC